MSYLKKTRLLSLMLVLLCSTFSVFAQERVVTGKVTDQQTGKPLEGVTVKVKNTTAVTATDAQGNFKIKVPSTESILTFTSVGYGVYEIKAGTSGSVLVTLTQTTNVMDDVVVVGYGTKKRVNIQGAVSTIKAADIEDLPVANLGSALINRVPGVSVSFASGKPGSTTDINIRNSVTFPGTQSGVTTQPLYVIDGVIMNPTIWAQSSNPDFFENLDASQIEDITFLKDASAAIYGAAGAKGVVLITTKKGKIGKPKISYSGYFGSSNNAYKTATLSAYDHARLLNSGYELSNASTSNRFSQADLDRLATMPNKTWADDLWKSGNVVRHTLNVSGGTDKITFFTGGSYYGETGNYGDIFAKKYSIRGSVNAQIVTGLSASLSFATDFNHESRNTLKSANSETDDLSIRALFLTPKWVPLTVKGQPVAYSGPNPPGNWSILGLFNSGNYTRTKSQGLTFNASLEYKPNFIKGLTAKVQFAKINRNNADKQYYPSYTVANYVKAGNNSLLYADSINALTPTTSITNSNQMSEGSTISQSYQIITTLSYAKKIKDHDFSAMVGMDQMEADSRNIFLTKFQQLVAGVDEFWAWSNDPTSAASITDLIRNPQATQVAKRSYIGRADYSFRSKYFLELIVRGDASSNFSPEHRWGFFPTVGLGWKLSDEKFLRDVKFINFLKLRVNYGKVGEDRVSNKTYINRYTQTTGYLFGNVYTNGLDPNLYPNPNATWEKARTINVGLDATLLKNKLTFSADIYQRFSTEIFNQMDASALPLSTGLISAVVNYGQQISWGTEFSVGYRTNINKDWGINADVNFGWSNAQVQQQFYSPVNFGLFGTNALSNVIGKDPRTYNGNNYGYIATGIIRTQAEVDAILAKNPNYTIGNVKPQVGFLNYKDINGDGKIDDNDITLMFDRTAAVVGFGFNIGVTYKSLKLQTNINLTIGGKRFYDTEARKVPTTTQNAPAFWSDAWTPNNPNAAYPRVDAPLAKELSTFWAVNGTQSRINNMVLSYSVPKRIITKYRIPDLKVMITGTNLWSIINPLKYKDPYTSNFANYPTLRTFSVGINASL